jgi:regulator of extracellular matrix RemA (YlzA/DUF370 family)
MNDYLRTTAQVSFGIISLKARRVAFRSEEIGPVKRIVRNCEEKERRLRIYRSRSLVVACRYAIWGMLTGVSPSLCATNTAVPRTGEQMIAFVSIR